MPQWTEELKQRRKATAIRNLMEDKQITLDKATEEYYARFRRNGAKGGRNSTGKTGFALMDEKRRKEVSKKGVEARNGSAK